MKIQVKIQICTEGARVPTYANEGDAGADIYLPNDEILFPNSTTIIPAGFKLAIPIGYEIQIRPRSGMSAKTKLRVANSPGTIDSNYKDEIGIIIDNLGNDIVRLKRGERIAQMVLKEQPTMDLVEVVDVKGYGDDRGGGFGSSGR